MLQKSNNSDKPKLPFEVIGALADAFDKSPLTIQRWVENGDDRLTSDKAKKVFISKNIDWTCAVLMG